MNDFALHLPLSLFWLHNVLVVTPSSELTSERLSTRAWFDPGPKRSVLISVQVVSGECALRFLIIHRSFQKKRMMRNGILCLYDSIKVTQLLAMAIVTKKVGNIGVRGAFVVVVVVFGINCRHFLFQVAGCCCCFSLIPLRK